MEYRLRQLTVIATVGLLLTAPAFYYLRGHSSPDLIGPSGEHQLHLTSRAAFRTSRTLNNLQQGLSHLARDGRNLLMDPRLAQRELALLASNHQTDLVTSLVLKDHEGNLVAEHPPHKLAKSYFPIHLLNNYKQFFSSPRLLSADGRPYLLLAQPIKDNRGDRGEIAALIALEDLREHFSLPPTGSAFFLDERGQFQLHDDPGLNGRTFSDIMEPAQHSELFALFSSMTRGEEGYYDLHGQDHPASGFFSGDRSMLTYAPLHLPGARWTLAMTGQPQRPSPPGLEQALLIYGGALILVCTTLFVCNLRLRRRFHRLATTQHLAEQEIAELRRSLELSEERYNQVLDHAGDAIFFIDPENGALHSINRRAEELLGYSVAEIRSLSLEVLFPGRERRRYLRLVKRVLREGYGEESNLRFRRKDGSLFIGEIHARRGRLGEGVAVHGVFRDVTEMRSIEQQLRRKNRELTLVNEISHRAAASRALGEMLKAILDRVLETFEADGGGIYLYREEDGRLHLTAHTGVGETDLARIATFCPQNGLVGRTLESGQPRTSSDLQKDSRASAEGLETGWRGFQAIPLAANDRTVGVLFLFSKAKRTLSREEIRLLVAIGRQVGTSVESARLFEALQWQHRLTRASNRELEASRRQLKENLRQLEEANRVLEGLDRLKSNFLALASHELRTPLTYILSSAELLRGQISGRLNVQEKRFLDAIHHGGKRLQEIVEDLLEMTRLESRNLYLGREQVDLRQLVIRVVDSFTKTLEERDLALTVDPFPASFHLIGDPDHLRRTLERLIENAIKFTPGGGAIEIRASRRTAGDIRASESQLRPFSPLFFSREPAEAMVQLTVHDTGIGIEPEEQMRIFEKFYEIGSIDDHSTSRTRFGGKGVGLGLTLVKGMIEAHGGMVWVESPGAGEEGLPGSAFHLILPLISNAEVMDATG